MHSRIAPTKVNKITVVTPYYYYSKLYAYIYQTLQFEQSSVNRLFVVTIQLYDHHLRIFVEESYM